jgi:hypothetical protein
VDVVLKRLLRAEGQYGHVPSVPGEAQPVTFSVYGAIAEHYKVDPSLIKESHASTLDYTIAATAG